MNQRADDPTARLLRGAFAGLVAGTVASFAMDLFQAGTARLFAGGGGGDQPEPATQQAADRVADTLIGHAIAPDDKPLAGQAVHYAFGIGLGLVYGIAAEFRPAVTAGYGTAFALGTATVLDEGAVPALGLGEPAWRAGWTGNLYSYASHLIFGGTTELVRRQVARTLAA